MTTFESIGPALTTLRQRRGWTRAELAKRAGITQTMVGIYEKGKVAPMLTTLQKMLDALGADRYELLNALLEARGVPREAAPLVEPGGRTDHHRRLLELLGLELGPQAEASLLGMYENLRGWFLAEGPAKPPTAGPS